MAKYILHITTGAFVLWTLFIFLVPSRFFGLTDFELGEVGGRGAVVIWLTGIVLWIVFRIGRTR
jgi:hypothetical protein